MRRCPWCGHENLNVYAYCQRCGRGFSEAVEEESKQAAEPNRRVQSFLNWVRGKRPAA